MQRQHQPETRQQAEGVSVLFEKYPAYVKLWNRSWGSMQMSEPYAQYFSRVDDSGDTLLIATEGANVGGMFNRVTGHLRLATAGDLFDVQCTPVQRMVP